MQGYQITPTLQQLLTNYDSMHRHPKSWALHIIGIPTISIATVGLTSLLRYPGGFWLNGSILLFLLNAFYFLPKDRVAGSMMLMANLPFFIIAPFLPAWLDVLFFL